MKYNTIFILVITIFLQSCSFFENKKLKQNPVEAIPIDASIIFSINDLEASFTKLSEENEFWQSFQAFEAMNRINKNVILIDSLKIVSNTFAQVFSTNKIYISLHAQGNNKVNSIYYTATSELVKAEKLINDIRSFTTDKFLEEREFSSIKIYTGTHLENTFYFYLYKGIVVFSQSKILIEKSVLQLFSESSLLDNASFLKVEETAGTNVAMNIFINFSQSDVFFKEITPNSSVFKNASKFSDWTELDMNIKNDHLLLNGFSYASDSLGNYFSCFRKQNPQSFDFPELLPQHIDWFLALGISNPTLYFDKYKQFSSANNAAFNSLIVKFKKNFGKDPFEFIEENLQDEIVLFKTGFTDLSSKENEFVGMKTFSGSNSKEKIQELVEAYAKTKSVNAKTFNSKIQIDIETEFDIYELPDCPLFDIVFKEFYQDLTFNFALVLDNYVVFAKNKKAVNRFVQHYVTRKNLRSSINYKAFSESFSSRSNLFYYIDIFKTQDSYPDIFQKSLSNEFKEKASDLQNLHAFSIQVNGGEELYYTNVILKYTDNLKEAPQTLWESRLDTVFNHKPYLVKNHYTNNKEVLVQDLKNNLYLISDLGRVLWKVKLSGQILSEVEQIDLYKNNKLQYLFNTKDKIYLLDRNGNNVENYPINLRSVATNGIAIFDYDGNKNYRIFVACEDKNIYAYDKYGKTVSGWKSNKTDHIITQPLQYYRIGSKDYIVFGDEFKTYILNRKGETRVSVSEAVHKSGNNRYFLDRKSGAKGPRLVTTDEKGRIVFIYFDGKVEYLKIADFSEEHFFELEDLDNDKNFELIFVDNGQLQVFNMGKRKLFEYNFKANIAHKPYIYEFSASDKKIGIVCETKKQLFLYNNDGKLYEGFPLEGNTQFSIGKFRNSPGKFNLLVGNYDNSLYNYKVD